MLGRCKKGEGDMQNIDLEERTGVLSGEKEKEEGRCKKEGRSGQEKKLGVRKFEKKKKKL